MGIISKGEAGLGSSLFENKLTSLGLLASALYVLYYAISGDFTGEGSKYDAFLQLFNSQPIARISTLDFSILSLMVRHVVVHHVRSLSVQIIEFVESFVQMWEPMAEDMARRGWKGLPAAAFCSIPVLGPVTYLCLRPALQDSK
jgi:hypothetical protein